MQMTNKVIAIDWDGTISINVMMWCSIIKTMQASNITVMVVTMRFKNEPIIDLNGVFEREVPIIYTGRKAKKDFLTALNIKPDIWIDDNPIFILTDAYEEAKDEHHVIRPGVNHFHDEKFIPHRTTGKDLTAFYSHYVGS